MQQESANCSNDHKEFGMIRSVPLVSSLDVAYFSHVLTPFESFFLSFVRGYYLFCCYVTEQNTVFA